MPKKRDSKRVSWKPENDAPETAAEPSPDIFSSGTNDEGTSTRSQSNDDRLRADKPPHWG